MAPLDENSMLTSKTLLARVKAADPAAWQNFFDRYWPFLIDYGKAAGLDDSTAQDVAQETIIQLWKALPDFHYRRDVCRFRTWLTTILKHRVSDHFRQMGRRRTVDLPDDDTGTGAFNRVAGPPSERPDVQLEAAWEAHLHRAARERVWRRFSQRELQIYEYYEQCDRSHRRTAKELGIPIARVYVAKNRVEREMKNELNRLRQELY